MKRKPTLQEKKAMARIGIDPEMWLIRKNPAEGLYLEHRHTGAKKFVPARLMKK